ESGKRSLAIATTVLPVTSAGASTDTRPSSAESCGATTATTPVGSGTEMLKYGPETGFALPASCEYLSHQPAYQTPRSMAASTCAPATAALTPSCWAISSMNWARRPSRISATRYSTCPRLYAVAPDQPFTAARAATTASLASLRDALAAFARKSPLAESTW